jgi:PAS domain S-box-containing protein
LDRIFRDAAVGMLVTDLEGRILEVNTAFASLVGYAPNQLAGVHVKDITYPGDVVISRHALDHGLATGSNSWIFEKRYVRNGGAPVWVRNSCSYLHDDHGMPARIVVFSQDISAQRTLEQNLKKSEWRFRSIIESLPLAISVLDRGGALVYESPFIEQLLGYRPEDRAERLATEYIHPEDLEAVLNAWRNQLAYYDATTVAEARCRHKDGSWRTVEFLGRNLLHNPVINGILLIARDVTQRAEARKRVLEYASETERRYFRLLNRFAGGRKQDDREILKAIVDDTRPALTGIANLVEILLETRLSGTQQECARKIQDAVATLQNTARLITEDREPGPEPEPGD